MPMPEAMAGPVTGTLPPTQQPQDLEDILEMADAAIWGRDGAMDEREMTALRVFYEAQQMKIEAFQRGERPQPGLGFAQTPEQVQQPQAPEGAGQTEDFMAGAGEPVGDDSQQQDEQYDEYDTGGY